MIRRPPRSTRTYTRFPSTTHFRVHNPVEHSVDVSDTGADRCKFGDQLAIVRAVARRGRQGGDTGFYAALEHLVGGDILLLRELLQGLVDGSWQADGVLNRLHRPAPARVRGALSKIPGNPDRKSTRLNSSH